MQVTCLKQNCRDGYLSSVHDDCDITSVAGTLWEPTGTLVVSGMRFGVLCFYPAVLSPGFQTIRDPVSPFLDSSKGSYAFVVVSFFIKEMSTGHASTCHFVTYRGFGNYTPRRPRDYAEFQTTESLIFLTV